MKDEFTISPTRSRSIRSRLHGAPDMRVWHGHEAVHPVHIVIGGVTLDVDLESAKHVCNGQIQTRISQTMSSGKG